MKTNNIKVTAKVIYISYKCTSFYGNPSYWVLFETESGTIHAYTASDAACGYGCKNYDGRMCEITYHFTRKGNAIITSMHKPE